MDRNPICKEQVADSKKIQIHVTGAKICKNIRLLMAKIFGGNFASQVNYHGQILEM